MWMLKICSRKLHTASAVVRILTARAFGNLSCRDQTPASGTFAQIALRWQQKQNACARCCWRQPPQVYALLRMSVLLLTWTEALETFFRIPKMNWKAKLRAAEPRGLMPVGLNGTKWIVHCLWLVQTCSPRLYFF